MRRVSLSIVAIIAVALLVVGAIAGPIIYYNGVVNNKNSQIASLNQLIEKENGQISNLTAQVSNLIDMTRTSENLTCTNYAIGSTGNGYGGWNWTVTLDLKNTGNATAIINNIVINGQPYSSFNPVPTINPSIQNGYALSPNQTVTITIRETNAASSPFQGSGKIYVLTAIGNSLEISYGS